MGKKKKDKLLHDPLPLRFQPYLDKEGWTQQELADRMQMSDVSVGRMMKGQQNWPQEALQRAAAAFGVSWADLLPAPGNGSVLDIWASIPPSQHDTALAVLKSFARKVA